MPFGPNPHEDPNTNWQPCPDCGQPMIERPYKGKTFGYPCGHYLHDGVPSQGAIDTFNRVVTWDRTRAEEDAARQPDSNATPVYGSVELKATTDG